MADHGSPADRSGPAKLIGDTVEFAFGQAKASHSAIDVQHRRQRTACGREPLPFGDLTRIVQHRDEPGLSEFRARARHQAIQHRNLDGLRQGFAQCQRLIERRDKKSSAAGLRQRSGDDRGAQAIAVGLNDRGAFGRSGMACQKPPIRDNARDIDLKNARGAIYRVTAHAPPLCPLSRNPRFDSNSFAPEQRADHHDSQLSASPFLCLRERVEIQTHKRLDPRCDARAGCAWRRQKGE